MNELQVTAGMVALFALRCIAPLVITFALGYAMNRLVDKWEREAQEAEAGAPIPAPQPAAAVEKPSVPSLPCWLVRGCDSQRRENCPAYQHSGPCWVAKMEALGFLPDNCPDCPVYQRAHA